ncbi:MAG: hypothetical protein NC223_09415 [Butyrivibrio sp.]|nr:hypothetical protein [Butyrivibrio sp.]
MKNGVRLRVAFDFCIWEKSRFAVSVLETVAFMCLAVQIIYMLASSYSFFDRVEKGLNIPAEQLGYYSIDTGNGDLAGKLRQVEGITHCGTVDSGNGMVIEHKDFDILRDIQEKHRRKNDGGGFSQGVQAISITEDLWEVMRLELVEGKKPSETECDDLGISPDILIYLSEDYKSVVQVGSVIHEQHYDEGSVKKYVVAGFLDKSSAVIDSYIFDAQSIEKQGYYPIGYKVLEVIRTEPFDSGFFAFEGDFTEVSDRIKALAAENGTTVEVYSIANVIDYMKSNTDKNTYYLKEAFLILAVIMLFAISAGQIVSIVTRTKNYGIWLASGASKKDLAVIIFMQNLIRMLISLVISLLLMLVLFRILYCTNEQNYYTVNSIYVRYVLPALALLSVLMVLISSVFPSRIILKASSVNLLKGRVN